MTDEHWADGEKRSLTIFIDAGTDRGLLLFLNSSTLDTTFTFPDEKWETPLDASLMHLISPLSTNQQFLFRERKRK